MVTSRIRAVSFAVAASALFSSASALSQNPTPLPSLPPPAPPSAPAAPPVYAPSAEPLPSLPAAPGPSTPIPATRPKPALEPPAILDSGPDPDEPKRFGVGLDATLLVPVGTLRKATGVLLGPLVRLDYRASPHLDIALRAGFLVGFNHGQTADDGSSYATSQTLLPVWLGGRYFLFYPNAGLYARGEVGLNLLQGHFHSDSDPLGDTSRLEKVRARLGFDVGAGYIVSEKLPVDVHVQFTYLNLLGNQTDVGTSATDDPFLGIGIGVGYTLSF